MQGENDNIDIKHDMLSKLKALHVMFKITSLKEGAGNMHA